MTNYSYHDQILSLKLCIFNNFQANKAEDKSVDVVFRIELDGDVHFRVALQKPDKNLKKRKKKIRR